MQKLLANLRYALRQFRQSPVFTIAAVLTLALGIGGTTAIFTLVHAVMLRSLPVKDPGSLYRIGEGDDCCVEGGPQDRWGFYSYALYERLKANTPEFEDVAAFQAGNWLLSVRRQGETAGRPVRGEYVTGNYFSMLGVRAFGGRLFGPDDDRAGAVVLPVDVEPVAEWVHVVAVVAGRGHLVADDLEHEAAVGDRAGRVTDVHVDVIVGAGLCVAWRQDSSGERVRVRIRRREVGN